MTTITKLPDLIDHLAAGDELVITRNQLPVARLSAAGPKQRRTRQAGSAKGQLTILAEDDDHLEGFEKYIE